MNIHNDCKNSQGALQERANKLAEIPEDRHEKLLEAKEDIIKMYESRVGIIDYVFIDHYDESIQVVLKSDRFESHKNDVKGNAKMIVDQKSASADIGGIKTEVKRFIPSATASDLMCAELFHDHRQRYIHCVQATIGFPATRTHDSGDASVTDSGFITVGHAFDEILSATAGVPSFLPQVFQPGPSEGDFRPSRINNTEWQAQVIGNLSYGIYQDNANGTDTVHDSAFVKLAPNKSVEPKVTIMTNNTLTAEWPITSYVPTTSQNVMDFVYQFGAFSGHTYGYIAAKTADAGVHAKYNECRGDSGAPVGRYYVGSGFGLYGMHLGIAAGSTVEDFDQTLQCNEDEDRDGYSRYVPYDTIADDLGIAGVRAPATVTGTVFSDTDGDGIQDEGENGISGYTVYAISGTNTRTATTDSSGVYTFDNVPSAPTSTLIQTGYFPQGHTVVDSNSSWFTHVTPQPLETVTFNVGFHPVTAEEQVTLAILAYRDDNSNGRWESGEPGVRGLVFQAYTYTIGYVAYPETGADGRAAVDDLVPADFAVLVDVDELAESGYAWTATNYLNRSDGTTGKQYDRTLPVVDDPAPGSTHTMHLAVVPVP